MPSYYNVEETYFSEDMASYKKGRVTVDLGYYRDWESDDPGEFIIYIVVDNDWDDWVGRLVFFDKLTAFSVLKSLAHVDFSNIQS